MKILDTLWFNGPQGCIGIVMGETEEGERKAYIGIASGTYEAMDIQVIAQTGAPLMDQAAKILFKHFHKAEPVNPGSKGDKHGCMFGDFP